MKADGKILAIAIKHFDSIKKAWRFEISVQ